MYLKSSEIYLIVGTISIIVVFLAFCPIEIITINNQTMFNTFFNLKFEDGGVFAAITVGIITVLVTGYFNIKNYKSLKLTSIPTNSANLLIDLEYIFNEYEVYNKNNEEDTFLLLLQILKYWKEHQQVFRLLTPHFYKKFIKIWSKAKTINQNDSKPEKNSKHILNALIIQLSDVAITNENDLYTFIAPELITDDETIENLNEDYVKFKINKKNLLEYINTISGKKTKKQTKNEFLKLYNDLTKLINELKREIEEYD